MQMTHEDWFNLVVCASLSVLGGIGQLLSAKNKKATKMKEIARNAVVSLSIGVGIFVIMYAFVPVARENDFVVFAAGYLIGWGGPLFMNKLLSKVAKEKGLDDEKK